MTIGQINTDIVSAFWRNRDIFDSSSKFLLHKKPEMYPLTEGIIEGYIFYFPRQIAREVVDGFKLKDNKGFISIMETYKKVNAREFTKIAHTYRYITDEYTYECKSDVAQPKNIPYNFHYDMDLDYDTPEHPSKHLQVLHSHPRFPIKEDSIDDFFLQVKTTCFDLDLNPLNFPIYR